MNEQNFIVTHHVHLNFITKKNKNIAMYHAQNDKIYSKFLVLDQNRETVFVKKKYYYDTKPYLISTIQLWTLA